MCQRCGAKPRQVTVRVVTDLIRSTDFELKEYRQAWLMRPITREELETPIPADVVRGRGKSSKLNGG